jgi:hypothetical protein
VCCEEVAVLQRPVCDPFRHASGDCLAWYAVLGSLIEALRLDGMLAKPNPHMIVVVEAVCLVFVGAARVSTFSLK